MKRDRTPGRSLSPHQRKRVAELRASPDGRLVAPRGPGHVASSWWQTARSLVALGYAREDGDGITMPMYLPGPIEALKARVVRGWQTLRVVQPANINQVATAANLSVDLTRAAVNELLHEGVFRKAKS